MYDKRTPLRSCSLILTFVTLGNSKNSNRQLTWESRRLNEKCSLFLAESSIQGAGFGIFTTAPISEGEQIFDPSVGVPIIDNVLQQDNKRPNWLLLDYAWQPSSPEMQFEAWEVDVLNFDPISTLANCHPSLTNVVPSVWSGASNLVSRSRDAGAGASTHYTGQKFVALRNIDAGEELFDYYGEAWFNERNDRFGNIPLRKNFEMGDKILQKMAYLVQDRNECPHNVDIILESVKTVVNMFDPITASVLPTKYHEFKHAVTTSVAWRTVQNRTSHWIEENGHCIDNLASGKSTIDGAGSGAFAKRNIRAGGLIAPIPLLHVLDKSTFDIFNWTVGDTGVRRRTNHRIGKQLLLNYCFGHDESSLLLCQTTGSALINHKRATHLGQKCNDKSCKNGPNAEIRWSKWDSTTTAWLRMSFEELSMQRGRGLSFDVVAIRDIMKGEEIFIDYGAAWENAWTRHTLEWRSPSGIFQDFIEPDLLNTNAARVRTRDELELKPYPPNIMTTCIYREDNEEKQKKELTIDLSTEEMIHFFSVSGKAFLPQSNTRQHYWPCKIYDRSGDGTYTVRIFQSVWEYERCADEGRLPRFLTEYPRESIRFLTKPYMSDLHLQAFRHPIGVRDGMFPRQWKNLVKEKNAP